MTPSSPDSRAANVRSPHTFHIPVLGTGFSIDSPLLVGRYGISSVISLVDDVLIEQMRRVHCEREGEPYTEIASTEDDSRARRITAYLDLVDRILARQVEALQSSPFEPNSEITRYYELLPECPLKDAYRTMLATEDAEEKARLEASLRQSAVPGLIEVNIMTKLDRRRTEKGVELPHEFSDAMSALRGFAQSTVEGAIVFSAGTNPPLYSYAAKFDGFLPDASGHLKKGIVLKVSDYRSAVIQGRFLAKRGLWVSEYRIESGLNCGGHAFASKGNLLGPILDEVKHNRGELTERVFGIYVKALEKLGCPVPSTPPQVRITAQGGIGTAEENRFFLDYYGIDGTGWATPFLLVPEATNVDDVHLEKLVAATEKEVFLSDSSPLGIPFWNLRNSGCEEARREAIRGGKPGSACPKGFLKLNAELTERPICTAAEAFQALKLRNLAESDLDDERRTRAEERTMAKSCICHGLGGGVLIRHGVDPDGTPAICPGLGITDFSKVATLDEMVGHIYGRECLMTNPDRPHIFIRELVLNVAHLRKELEDNRLGLAEREAKYFHEFRANLNDGIRTYEAMVPELPEDIRPGFQADLTRIAADLEQITLPDVE